MRTFTVVLSDIYLAFMPLFRPFALWLPMRHHVHHIPKPIRHVSSQCWLHLTLGWRGLYPHPANSTSTSRTIDVGDRSTDTLSQ